MSGTEILLVVRVIKMLIDKGMEIKKENEETKKLIDTLSRDLFVVVLVCEEIDRSKVVVNPDLQTAMKILKERLDEVRDSLEAIAEQHSKKKYRIFFSKQMLKQAKDATVKLSDQIEVLPAAFEAQRYAQDRAIKDASSDFHSAVDFFVNEKNSNTMWKDLRTLDPEFRYLYEKLAEAAPDLLEGKFDDKGSSKSDSTVIAEALGIENGVNGKASLVKFSKWVEGKSLYDAVSGALLKSMQAEFHRRRKKLLCPDLEIFWIGPHLAELDTRETIRQCFQEAAGKRFTFNITHAGTVGDAEKLLSIGSSRLIGQIVSGRVIVITTVGMEKRVREMLNRSRIKDAKAIKEPSTGSTISREPSAGSTISREPSAGSTISREASTGSTISRVNSGATMVSADLPRASEASSADHPRSDSVVSASVSGLNSPISMGSGAGQSFNFSRVNSGASLDHPRTDSVTSMDNPRRDSVASVGMTKLDSGGSLGSGGYNFSIVVSGATSDKTADTPPQAAATVTDAESKVPDPGTEEQQKMLKVIVYHNNYKSYQKHLKMSQPEYVAIGSPSLKEVIFTSGNSILPVTPERIAEIEAELDKLTTDN
eukprot:TRINITY_DN5102_c1_g1_i1.p1 TRINITY_DN5102_c1_g1~~TRINITY_DN5102_c1_g1_i1.p1  ORF type:complete len:595 (+),score=180.37 TRINITY_DN5102_c1_g1_i1:37-1821(+)